LGTVQFRKCRQQAWVIKPCTQFSDNSVEVTKVYTVHTTTIKVK